MKFIKFLLIIFISINTSIKADSKQTLIKELKKGGKLIFIRHAYAPGGGDPNNFNIKDCTTQRNLNDYGRKQAKKIGAFFNNNNIPINEIYSSEWCRCKETALIAFNQFEKKFFLNSFFSAEFSMNRDLQMKNLKNFIKNRDVKHNIIFVTHYVVISEAINYSPDSGEIIILDENYNILGNVITRLDK